MFSASHRLLPGRLSGYEEGPEALTEFLLLEVKKLQEQLRNARLCERRLSKRCRAEGKAHDHRYERLQLESLDFTSGPPADPGTRKPAGAP
ncbi:unnamed protein product [Boreogadus saida]